MNARQYEWTRTNRRFSPLKVDELTPRAARRKAAGEREICSPLARILKRAAEQVRARQSAEAAWAQVARPAWRDGVAVASVVNGIVTLMLRSSAMSYELGRQKAALERDFRRLLPGFGGLKFEVAGENPEPITGERGS